MKYAFCSSEGLEATFYLFDLQEVALNLAKEERNGSPAPSSPPRPLVTPGSLALAALHSGQLSLSQV
jgi:hypothetical protein